MTTKGIVFLLLYSAILGSCAESMYSSSWRAEGVTLKRYKTYAWMAPGDSALNHRRDDKLFAGSILLAANTELRNKGMVMGTRSPDAVFMFDTQLEDRMRYSQSPTVSVGVGFAGPGYYTGGMAPIAGGEVTSTGFQQGTLVIEMYDLKTHQLLWRAWATAPIDYTADVETLIRKATHDIFIYLPIKH